MKGRSDVRAGWHLAAVQDLSARIAPKDPIPFPISFFEKVSLPILVQGLYTIGNQS